MINTRKAELSKKDMNFFSAFSSSSTQLSSYLSTLILVFIGLFILGAVFYAVYFFQLQRVKKDVNALNAEFVSAEYSDQLNMYTSVNTDINSINQQYYDISELFSRITAMDKVETSILDTINGNIPKDIIVTAFTYADNSITLTGLADSYYSPLDFLANLSSSKLFTYVEISDITQRDISGIALNENEVGLAKPYTFTFVGSLKSSYIVKVTKKTDDASLAPLSDVESTSYPVGETYSVQGINTVTSGSYVYTLSRVEIDGVTQDATTFGLIQQSDSVIGLVSTTVDIVLYYTLTSTNGGAQ